MVDRLEENLGKYPYVTLAQVKDYLSISSNTQNARLSNIISYATGVVEHYIGQEVLANDYVEVFDGGKTSVMVSNENSAKGLLKLTVCKFNFEIIEVNSKLFLLITPYPPIHAKAIPVPIIILFLISE